MRMRRPILVAALAGPRLGQALAPEFGAVLPSGCEKLPTGLELTNQSYTLPDPFTLLGGGPVLSFSDWDCRAAQLRSLFQEYELGWKPPRPAVLATILTLDDVLTVTTGNSTKNVTFSVPISYPNDMAGIGPFPVIIAFDELLLPRPPSVAVITLNVSAIAEQDGPGSRGKGLFYDLYGADATAGALMAWAWAVSRVLDALEVTPAMAGRIDAARVAVTGCSRNGKGALVAGAFDERIALTVPQESGAGGDACWRVSRALAADDGLAAQTAAQVTAENVWFGRVFDVFARDRDGVGLLPVDHHELAALIAPRGLYSTSNIGFPWPGGQSSFQCMTAANAAFRALGAAGNQGFSEDGPHARCAFPADQQGELQAFYEKFLFGRDVDTGVLRTATNGSFDPSWVPWKTPVLVAGATFRNASED